MKINYFFYYIIIMLVPCIILGSCKKFLDAKSNKSLAVPSSLGDFQAIIDYYSRVNFRHPGAGVVGADEYYLTDIEFNELSSEQNRNMYIWNNENVFTSGDNSWSYTFDRVYKANTVLEGLAKIKRTKQNAKDWDNLKGQALFLRGESFFEAAVIWNLAYDENESMNDLGLPLRLHTDFNEPSVRSSVEITYNQIISDIKESINLLPNTPVHIFRASKPAACGMLARCYLAMRNYDSCNKYVGIALNIKNDLIDYNLLDSNKAYPITRLNSEIVLESKLILSYTASRRVDSILFRLYDINDLRRVLYFDKNADGSHRFKGSYEGSAASFGGLATDELYIMYAESLARGGNIKDAMFYLNTLLKNRYKKGSFTSINITDQKQALQYILTERRKELIMRGLRWMDIKRLNKEGANIILKRIVGGQVITLLPNDLRFAMAIPEDVINISGMQQNPR